MSVHARSSRPQGYVTGYLLKLIRESIPLTQEQVAAELGVDRATVQSWESGRRSFTAVPFGQALTVRQKLGRLGASVRLLAAVDDAAEADSIVANILDQQMERADLSQQALGWSVLTHRLSDLIVWAVTGRRPSFVRDLPSPHPRRGPVADGPILPADQRHAFFQQLHVLAERAAAGRHDLLHRQACFLAGTDPTKESASWLAQHNSRTARRMTSLHTWSPTWADARSVVTSLANQGNPEPLRDFIARAHPDDACQHAALNYSAYWVGELPYRQRNDSFMPAARTDWRGSRLLRHLVARLRAGHPFVDLNIHNTWALLAARRGLSHDDPATSRALVDRSTALLDHYSISAQSRQELTSIVYSLRADGITGTRTGT
ncbi:MULTISPECIES: helix-turn-helix transcriptional regulator [unclassified Micromonospora]|uniref:helix-turn-helix domain-containing protein n=1 Tax=unclassified Micromonospora TaxID=2617518 RepID=UPI0022B71D1C|nr:MULTISPECIES: helix-turn-helix transcriptional regulator [unclassified Micromonospora]MCZ7422432.1 helix-turn-helix transcriptional regulator [Verrucosispora sp. WMMA2121]WBB90180.1 helix-turn-helix transcriptional regulator [Verrucosispora sp. WMMC514]